MTMPARPPRQRERSEQAVIAQLLRALGAKVYTLGTTRRKTDSHFGTMQTPGLPDVIAFLKLPPAPTMPTWTRRMLVIECKAPGGRLRPEQNEFRGLCLAADVAHVVGGLDDVIAWLITHGHANANQFPHYRVPQGVTDGR